MRSGALVKLPNDENITPSVLSFARLDDAGELTRRPLKEIDLRVTGRVFLTPVADEMGGAA